MTDRVAYVVAVLALLFAFGYWAGQASVADTLPRLHVGPQATCPPYSVAPMPDASGYCYPD